MKKLLSSLFLLLAVFSLASCAGGGGNTKDDRIQVKFWHAMGQTNQDIIQEMIDTFEAKYPNVHIDQAKQGGYPDLLQKIKDNIKAGTGPALAQTYPDHVTSYLSAQDAVVDLNEYIYDEQLGFEAQGVDSAQFIDSFYKEGTSYDKEGSMYSLPFNKSTEVVFYNQTIFNKYDWFCGLLGLKQEDVYSKYVGAGSNENVINKDFIWQPTWEQLEKIATEFLSTAEYKAITADGKTKSYAFSADSSSNLFITLTQQLAALDKDAKFGAKGEEAYTRFQENGLGEFSFLRKDNPYGRDAINYYKDKLDKGLFATAGFLGAEHSSDAFKEGSCIITTGSTAGAKYNVPGDGQEAFEVGVATYPQFEATPLEKYQVIQQGTNVTLFRQKDPEVEKYAWLFMLHMTNFENSLKWSTKTSYFPIRHDTYESQKYQDFIVGKEEDDQGNVIYAPKLGAKAQKVGWTQRSWFFTNVAFNGSDISRSEMELAMDAVLLGEETVESAFVNVADHLKNYIIKQ